MSAKRAAIAVLGVTVVMCCVSCGKKEEGIEVKSGLAARVAGHKITGDAVEKLFSELPSSQRKEFRGPDGKAKFVDKIIDQHLIYQAALDAKLDKEESIRDRMRWLTMNLMVAEYFNRVIAKKANVDEAEIEKYYAEHKDEFKKPPVLRAQYLFTEDSLKAVDWRKRLLAGGIMTEMAHKESEDKLTAVAGGDVGYFNPGGFIKGIGQSKIFSEAAESLEVGKISDIVHFEKGFAIIRLSEKNPAGVQTLDEARRGIEDKLRSQMAEELLQQEIERLRKKYPNENYYREMFEKTTRTAAELWEMAQMETDARERIQYYRDIVNQYPDDKNAPQALFMIGFTYAEDLGDFVFARRTFDELIKKYPSSEVVESAKWMLENMDAPGMELESAEDVMRKAAESATGGGTEQ